MTTTLRFFRALVKLTPSWVKVALVILSCVGAARCVAPDATYDAMVAARRPLVIISGVTQQLPTADYISSVGGVTTNATAAAAGDMQTTTLTSSGVATVGGSTNTAQTRRTGIITPTLVSGTNWNPTGLATASQIDVVLTADGTIGGLEAQPTGTEIVIRNSHASFILTILSDSAGSLAANRFSLGSSIAMQPFQSITVRYTGSNWVSVGGGFGGGLGVTGIAASIAVIGETRLVVQTSTTTGTQNDVALNSVNSGATVYRYNGTGAATFTGFSGGTNGRIVIVQNVSPHELTLQSNTGSAAGAQFRNTSGADLVLEGSQGGSFGASAAIYVYESSQGYWVLVGVVSSKNAIPTAFTSTKNRGTLTLVAGAGTATVQSGSICTCTDATAANAVKCSVATTTLTATGTGTDVVAYLCF